MGKEPAQSFDPRRIKCAVFGFDKTLSSDHYFKIAPPNTPKWQEVIREHVFGDAFVLIPWKKGEISSREVAEVIARHIPLDAAAIQETMEKGCEKMSLNLAVWNFAVMLKMTGRKTALVCDNTDILTNVIVPAHKLERTFDVIVNSADAHELQSENLWQAAFKELGEGIGLGNSLLIEAEESKVEKFRQSGGYAHTYKDEKAFLNWYHSMDWERPVYG